MLYVRRSAVCRVGPSPLGRTSHEVERLFLVVPAFTAGKQVPGLRSERRKGKGGCVSACLLMKESASLRSVVKGEMRGFLAALGMTTNSGQ